MKLSTVAQPHPPGKTPVQYANPQFHVSQPSSLQSPPLPVNAPPTGSVVVAGDRSYQPTLTGPLSDDGGGARGGVSEGGGGGGRSLEQLHVLNTAKSRQISELKRQLVAQKEESERHATVLREEKVSVEEC